MRSAPSLHAPGARKLATHTLLNLGGLSLPMVVALVCIPILIRGLGEDRFGALTLVWMLVGYFSMFDLGLGRALTKFTAERLSRGEQDRLAPLFHTALVLMVGLGAIGGVMLFLGAPWLVTRGINVPVGLEVEALRSLKSVALVLPVIVVASGLVGVLEAYHRFGVLNGVRLAMGVYTFAAPVAVLPFTQRLDAVVVALAVGRVIEAAVLVTTCLATGPHLRRWSFERAEIPRLLGFGGWMTVSNFAMPFLVHVDRFIISARRTLSEVTWFATPAEVVVKLLILPRAWVASVFPTFVARAQGEREAAAAFFGQTFRVLVLGMLAPAAGLLLVAPEFLTLWLGPEFAERSTEVTRALTLGIYLNGLAYIPFVLLQSLHRPDLCAKLHLIEAPVYILIQMAVVSRWGIEGAAVGFVARAGVELVVLGGMATRFLPSARADVARGTLFAVASGTALALIAILDSLLLRLGLGAGLGILVGGVAWNWLLTDGDRAWCMGLVRRGQ